MYVLNRIPGFLDDRNELPQRDFLPPPLGGDGGWRLTAQFAPHSLVVVSYMERAKRCSVHTACNHRRCTIDSQRACTRACTLAARCFSR